MTWLWVLGAMIAASAYSLWLNVIIRSGYAREMASDLHPMLLLTESRWWTAGQHELLQLAAFCWLVPWTEMQPERTFFDVAARFVFATVIQDSWHYWIHRLLHANTWLYHHVHAPHHTLPIPIYLAHVAESIVRDACAFMLAVTVAGLDTSSMAILWAASSMKTTHDHSGVTLPAFLDPLTLWSAISDNNSAYHHIHHTTLHQNFQSLWWTFFDDYCGTRSPA